MVDTREPRENQVITPLHLMGTKMSHGCCVCGYHHHHHDHHHHDRDHHHHHHHSSKHLTTSITTDWHQRETKKAPSDLYVSKDKGRTAHPFHPSASNNYTHHPSSCIIAFQGKTAAVTTTNSTTTYYPASSSTTSISYSSAPLVYTHHKGWQSPTTISSSFNCQYSYPYISSSVNQALPPVTTPCFRLSYGICSFETPFT